MNKDTNKSTYKQVFDVLLKLNKRFESDRYMKKMSTIQFVELMVNAQINQEPALRCDCPR